MPVGQHGSCVFVLSLVSQFGKWNGRLVNLRWQLVSMFPVTTDCSLRSAHGVL